MRYELAKQLSEAGFPNLGVYYHNFIEEPLNDPLKPGWNIKATCEKCGEVRKYSSGGIHTSDFNNGCSVVRDYRKPTLSELIEACGDEFTFLEKMDKTWTAFPPMPNYKNGQHGSTPEEAVAKLWLELNKK
jgi:hypothetical protein